MLLKWFSMTAKYASMAAVLGHISELLSVHVTKDKQKRERFQQAFDQNRRYIDAKAFVNALIPDKSDG